VLVETDQLSESLSDGASERRLSEDARSALTGKKAKNTSIFPPKNLFYKEALGNACMKWLPVLCYEGSSRNGAGFPSGIETYSSTTVALVSGEQELSRPGPPKRQQLLQVRVQRGSSLLESRDGQALSLAQMDIVGVIADVAMRPPGSLTDALDLPMRGQAPHFAHKTKRRAGREPGKPGWAVRLKGQQAAFWTDQHIVPLSRILHQS
jgi:hypothetical protein